MKKALSLLLALLCVLSAAACGEDQPNADKEAEGNVTTVSQTEVETSYLEALNVVSYEGGEFKICVNSQYDRPNVHDGEETGEIINDMLYRRDEKVGVIFDTSVVYTVYENRDSQIADVIKLVSADEDVYDMIIAVPGAGINQLAPGGYLADLASISGIELSNEWWCQSMNETMEFNNKVLATAGPIALCYCYAPYTIFANLTMMEDYQMEDIYDVVKDGKWTIDKLGEMIKDIGSDLNNDGKMRAADDFFGMSVTAEAGKAFYVGCGMSAVDKKDDSVTLMMDTEKSISILDKLHTLCDADNVIYTDSLGKNKAGIDYRYALFIDQQTMFCASPMQWGLLNFRSMEDDYAILPFPKLDDTQTEYYSHINSFFPVASCVPVTCGRMNIVGYVMEALAFLSQTTVVPEINEVVLKEKVARDEDSKLMIDLIYRNMTTDLNGIYNFGGSNTILREYAVAYKREFLSAYEKIKEKAMSDVESMIEAHRKNY
ncbi:MAG: hypothetical protein IJA85_01840 [Clostridia bacterium]|nr:hypothetical protein [Clostridia bacterium]